MTVSSPPSCTARAVGQTGAVLLEMFYILYITCDFTFKWDKNIVLCHEHLQEITFKLPKYQNRMIIRSFVTKTAKNSRQLKVIKLIN